MAATTTITRRLEACSCGCEGSDPWHARSYERVLHNARPATGTATVHAFRQPVQIRAEAEARLPWGEGRPVRVVDVTIAGRSLGWFTAL